MQLVEMNNKKTYIYKVDQLIVMKWAEKQHEIEFPIQANCFKHTDLFEEKNQEIEQSEGTSTMEQELTILIDQLPIHYLMSINIHLNLEEEE